MTNHTEAPPLGHDARTASPPAGPDRETRSLRRAGLVAGASLILMSVLAGYGNLVVLEGLVTPGEPARTASDILASEGAFRLGVACLYAVIVLDIVVAWALFRFFSPVSREISRLAAWIRLAYSVVFMVAVGQLAGVPDLLGGDGYSGALGAEQLPAQAMLKIDAFTDIWMAGLILFGAHLLLLGYLAYRSGYVPRVLGVLLVVAGLGYAFDSFVTVFSGGSPFAVSTVTFLGEFLLAVWLLARSHRVSATAERGHAHVL